MTGEIFHYLADGYKQAIAFKNKTPLGEFEKQHLYQTPSGWLQWAFVIFWYLAFFAAWIVLFILGLQRYLDSGPVVESSKISFSDITFPAVTICPNDVSGVISASLINCTGYHLISANNNCYPFQSFDCNQQIENLISPCGRKCIRMFVNQPLEATSAADHLVLQVQIGRSEGPNTPWEGGFGYLHNESVNPFDASVSFDNYVILHAQSYNYLSIVRRALTANDTTTISFGVVPQWTPLSSRFDNGTVLIEMSFDTFLSDTDLLLAKQTFDDFLSDIGGQLRLSEIALFFLAMSLSVVRCCESKNKKKPEPKHTVEVS